jgi:hypothetical protein
MNTIKTDENLTVILPVMKDKQVITLHNVAKNQTYIFKSEIKEVENVCNSSMVFNNQKSFMENKPELELGSLTAKTKRWKPRIGERYWIVNCWGNFYSVGGDDAQQNEYNLSIGNYYQEHEQERAIWEQVTRRKYEAALWDAADWVEGDGFSYSAYFDSTIRAISGIDCDYDSYDTLPRFTTTQSAIDAHTRILGDDAERYFTHRS